MKFSSLLILPSLALGHLFGANETVKYGDPWVLVQAQRQPSVQYMSYAELQASFDDQLAVKETKEDKIDQLAKFMNGLEANQAKYDATTVQQIRHGMDAREKFALYIHGEIEKRLPEEKRVVKEGSRLANLQTRMIMFQYNLLTENKAVNLVLREQLGNQESATVKILGKENAARMLMLLEEPELAANRSGTSHLVKRYSNPLMNQIAYLWIYICIVNIIVTAPTVWGPIVWGIMLGIWIFLLLQKVQ